MAAETAARAGADVVVHDAMPSAARKFLMAGRGGLNLTHSEDAGAFLGRYGEASGWVAGWLEDFSPADLVTWAEGLGQPTFVGSSGRVFPTAMKASPLLRAWLARLGDLGVEVRTRSRWHGWAEDGALVFQASGGTRRERPCATVLALGGASWPRLGSDAAWVPWLAGRGVRVAPFRPANVGVQVAWSSVLIGRFAGTPLKNVSLSFAGRTVRGEAMLTAYGIEGGAIYALSRALREAVEASGSATLVLDLKPDLTLGGLARRLAAGRPGESLANRLRKAGLSPVEIALLREGRPSPPTAPEDLAAVVKAVPLSLTGVQGLERAISSAGGVVRGALTDDLELTQAPGVFVAGEMLDWEAPTGGYLLQASFASGRRAGAAAARHGLRG